MPCSAIILGGGRSRRMGPHVDKALLSLEGRTLLARTVDTLSRIADDVMVVGRAELPAGCAPARLIADSVPGAGPLAGLHAGLLAAHHPIVICTACDYPFLSGAVIELLLARFSGHDAAVPRTGEVEHVTQAVYARAIAGVVEGHLRRRSYALRALFADLVVAWVGEADLRRVDPDLRSLLNVNTPEDWERAQALVSPTD